MLPNVPYLLDKKTTTLLKAEDYYAKKINFTNAHEAIFIYWNELKKNLYKNVVQDLHINEYELSILRNLANYNMGDNIQKFFKFLQIKNSFNSPLNHDNNWINPLGLRLELSNTDEFGLFIQFVIKFFYKRGNAELLAALDVWSQTYFNDNQKENDFLLFQKFNPYDEEHLKFFINEFNHQFQKLTLNGFKSSPLFQLEINQDNHYQLALTNNHGNLVMKNQNKMTYALTTASHNSSEFYLQDIIELKKFTEKLGMEFESKMYLNTPLKASFNQELNMDFESIAIIHLIQMLNNVNQEDIEATINYFNNADLDAQFFGSHFAEEWNRTNHKLEIIESRLEFSTALIQSKSNKWISSPDFKKFKYSLALKIAKSFKSVNRLLEKLNYQKRNKILKNVVKMTNEVKREDSLNKLQIKALRTELKMIKQ